MWNKDDIRAVLLWNGTSTASFHALFKTWPTFQELKSIVRSEGDAGVNGISAKIETYSVTKVKIYLVKYEDYEEIFFLPPDVGVAVLVCFRSLMSATQVVQVKASDKTAARQ